jgi:hypothetical protein
VTEDGIDRFEELKGLLEPVTGMILDELLGLMDDFNAVTEDGIDHFEELKGLLEPVAGMILDELLGLMDDFNAVEEEVKIGAGEEELLSLVLDYNKGLVNFRNTPTKLTISYLESVECGVVELNEWRLLVPMTPADAWEANKRRTRHALQADGSQLLEECILKRKKRVE